MTSGFTHVTVLLRETVALLRPEAGRVLIDGTLGGGGHSEALLEAGATVIGIDRDPRALAAARARLARFGERFAVREGAFAEVLAGYPTPVDGVLLDLGVSSPQLDEAERGFSFMADGPLDMRMAATGPTAAELIAETAEGELADLIYQYADERFSRPIARELKAAQPTRTFEAVEAIKKAVPRRAWPKDVNVATRTFQALRIAVNRELEELAQALATLPRLLKPGGVAAIISFHSLEDRAVKQAFKQLCGDAGPIDRRHAELQAMAGVTASPAPFKALTKKAVVAGDDELSRNPRARSAKLRAVERVT